MADEPSPVRIQVPFLKLIGDRIAEVVETPRRLRFAVYDQTFDDLKYYDEIGEEEVDVRASRIRVPEGLDPGRPIVFVPPPIDLVNDNVVLLPSEAAGYRNIADLFNNTKDFIAKWYTCDPQIAVESALYVMLTWVYDCFRTVPYLRIIGERGGGKTRYCLVCGYLCLRATKMAGAFSEAGLYRTIDLWRGTMIFDEVDLSKNNDVTVAINTILNVGWNVEFPVIRVKGNPEKGFTPEGISPFSPKIMNTRKRFYDEALESRCLTNHASGGRDSETPIELIDEFRAEALSLRNQLLMFRLRHWGRQKPDYTIKLEDVEDRMLQLAVPLLSLIPEEEELRDVILNKIREQQDTAIAERSNSSKRWVAEYACLAVIEGDNDFKPSELSERINTDRGWRIRAETVGKILRDAYHLEPHHKADGSHYSLDARFPERVKWFGVDKVVIKRVETALATSKGHFSLTELTELTDDEKHSGTRTKGSRIPESEPRPTDFTSSDYNTILDMSNLSNSPESGLHAPSDLSDLSDPDVENLTGTDDGPSSVSLLSAKNGVAGKIVGFFMNMPKATLRQFYESSGLRMAEVEPAVKWLREQGAIYSPRVGTFAVDETRWNEIRGDLDLEEKSDPALEELERCLEEEPGEVT